MFDNFKTNEERNPKFGTIGDDASMTVSFIDTKKKKMHMAVVIGMVAVWLLYVGYDRVIRVNVQKYQLKKAQEAIQISQVKAGRKAKLLLNKNVRYVKRRRVKRVSRKTKY
jgi:hypothetical protein